LIEAVTELLYPELARIAAALSSPTRVRALNLLFQGPKTVEEMAALLGESEANTAAHMKALRASNLVQAERQGKYVRLHAGNAAVLRLFVALREAGEQLSADLRLLDGELQSTASSVTLDELGELVESRRVVLVDLRPEAEYGAGHIPGARSVPYRRLAERAAELPASRRVLAYCRGKFCPSAHQGVFELREAGLRAERLPFGVPEWQASGRSLVAPRARGVS
jgi:DNA-binding transcriptional ArsR family regulator/rhodanese-related sulfurtransferase